MDQRNADVAEQNEVDHDHQPVLLRLMPLGLAAFVVTSMLYIYNSR